MNLIEEAFQRLFPEENFEFQPILKYNKKLGDFNANIRQRQGKLQVHLNYKWREIDKEIRIGLLQTLLLKMFWGRYGSKPLTFNIELYNSFIKKIPLMTPKTSSEPLLEESFHRVNKNYFYDLMEKPNLAWGAASFRKLAHYNFHNDTVVVSSIFKTAPGVIIDYLVYHELLHKKEKFKYKNNRNYFHTRRFKEAEELFPDKKQVEKQIQQMIKQHKRKNNFLSFFR